jgi:RNA polymerase sigma factor (sigma-70 family)
MASRSRYQPEHVRALVEEYADLRAKVDTTRRGLHFLVQLADLGRALRWLHLQHWEVVLLHGLLGLPQRTVAEVLGTSQSSVRRRYRDALEHLTITMNGD